MRLKLPNKVAWVTGASSGLGRALSISLAKRGAVVVLGARRLKELRQTAEVCRQAGAPATWAGRLDVASVSSVKSFVKQGLKFSRRQADILVNNAGVHLFGKVEDLTEPKLEKAVSINVKGPIRMVQALLPALKRGRGTVVQISSSLAWRSMAGAAGYAASKAALDRVTESLRDEAANDGVHVLNVHPGVVVTDLRRNALVDGPLPGGKLPFPQSAQHVAEKIVTAIEKDKRRLFAAPLWLRLFYGYMNWFIPSWVDDRMKHVDARNL